MPDYWDDYERLGHLLQAAPWRFATTMASNPHHYTLREDWDDDAFAWAVDFLREHGYTARFGRTDYRQIDVNSHFYWTMGAPIPETILINRKVLRRDHVYNQVSHRYDTYFRTPDAEAEECEVLGFIEEVAGDIARHDVLDIGSGTGLLLNHVHPVRYLGIDPAPGMIGLCRHRYPDAAVIGTDLAHFVPSAPDRRYSLVLALFGTGSYLTPHELGRIPRLLAPGGHAFLMFYRDDQPVTTHQLSGARPQYRTGAPPDDILAGTVHKVSTYDLLHVTREPA